MVREDLSDNGKGRPTSRYMSEFCRRAQLVLETKIAALLAAHNVGNSFFVAGN